MNRLKNFITNSVPDTDPAIKEMDEMARKARRDLDTLGLVSALGHASVAVVVGHDFSSPVAAHCALIRPDVFRSVALMSAPFAGPLKWPFNTADEGSG